MYRREPEESEEHAWYWGLGQGEEQELASKMLQIQSKRFYLDVKENPRGRFIKVAEIGADGRRSQIYLALSTAAEFRDHLSTFSDFYASLGPPNPENVPEDGKLKSEVMIKANRRYYLDLKVSKDYFFSLSTFSACEEFLISFHFLCVLEHI